MFDKKMVCHEGLRNETADGEVIGFSFLARLPYYRGLGMSMIEDIAVSVDGEKFPRDAISFSVRDRTWSLDAMETEYGDRWNFGEKARITVQKAGGLAAGKHQIEIAERLRISYLPFIPTTRGTNEVELSEA